MIGCFRHEKKYYSCNAPHWSLRPTKRGGVRPKGRTELVTGARTGNGRAIAPAAMPLRHESLRHGKESSEKHNSGGISAGDGCCCVTCWSTIWRDDMRHEEGA